MHVKKQGRNERKKLSNCSKIPAHKKKDNFWVHEKIKVEESDKAFDLKG